MATARELAARRYREEERMKWFIDDLKEREAVRR
jgi:hypothetical protein